MNYFLIQFLAFMELGFAVDGSGDVFCPVEYNRLA